ncbi:MAG: C-terminal binding protein [Acidobacteriota bacterium]
MTFRILWPLMRWDDDRSIERDALGEGFEPQFAAHFEEISDDDWARCDAIVSYVDIPRESRAKLERCKIFVTPKVGFDNIDLAAWDELGIPVCNVPDYGTMEVADHAIALMLTLMKGTHLHTERLRGDLIGHWEPTLNPFGKRLSDCTFGVVGLGRIGTAAALRAKAFGMKVLFVDPFVSNGVDLALGVERLRSLSEMASRCDVLSVHAPLCKGTRNLVDGTALERASDLVLVNTARGEVVDLDALYSALKDGRVRAAGLDVLPVEPPKQSHPLLDAFTADEEWIRHRLVLTPHSAFFTPESARDMRAKGTEVAVRFLRDGILENVVDAEKGG